MSPQLHAIAEQLLTTTKASRVTVRGPRFPGQVGTHLLAEALAPGVESMRNAPQQGIAQAPTYAFLRTERRPLVQNDCSKDPLPPAMLTQRYHVAAQMLGPLLDGEKLIGTVSVHQVGCVRAWSASDLAALTSAVQQVHAAYRLPVSAAGTPVTRTLGG